MGEKQFNLRHRLNLLSFITTSDKCGRLSKSVNDECRGCASLEENKTTLSDMLYSLFYKIQNNVLHSLDLNSLDGSHSRRGKCFYNSFPMLIKPPAFQWLPILLYEKVSL